MTILILFGLMAAAGYGAAKGLKAAVAHPETTAGAGKFLWKLFTK